MSNVELAARQSKPYELSRNTADPAANVSKVNASNDWRLGAHAAARRPSITSESSVSRRRQNSTLAGPSRSADACNNPLFSYRTTDRWLFHRPRFLTSSTVRLPLQRSIDAPLCRP
jgi:hypothetical protein